MPKQMAELDRVLHALADPTRRAVLERLGDGPAATTELARPFAMALPSFTQHLDVLQRTGLVTSSKSGRVRTWAIATEPLTAVASWLDEQRSHWERRLDQLDDHLTTMKEQTP